MARIDFICRSVLCALVCSLAAGVARADSLETLASFIKNVKSGRAEFTQTVTEPAREGQVAKTKTSSGSFEFLRPNRFKFIYRKPFEQSIVADGETLWLYDKDLNQVSARKLREALSGTPAAVIASAQDLQALQSQFSLQAMPDRDGLQWVAARPMAKDGQLQMVMVGFRGPALAALDILDSFGQHSVMTFSQVETNPSLSAAGFQFKPPPGAGVIRP